MRRSSAALALKSRPPAKLLGTNASKIRGSAETSDTPATTPASRISVAISVSRHSARAAAGHVLGGVGLHQDHAVEQVAATTRELLGALVTTAPPRDRETEAARARERAAKRYAATA